MVEPRGTPFRGPAHTAPVAGTGLIRRLLSGIPIGTPARHRPPGLAAFPPIRLRSRYPFASPIGHPNRLYLVTVRVRFAPSPTGIFHVGGARSALQNWIYAKQHGGAFALRLEDTDASRNRPEWVEGILSALDWIGIARGTYEGPYLQSGHAEEHTKAAADLYATGHAY